MGRSGRSGGEGESLLDWDTVLELLRHCERAGASILKVGKEINVNCQNGTIKFVFSALYSGYLEDVHCVVVCDRKMHSWVSMSDVEYCGVVRYGEEKMAKIIVRGPAELHIEINNGLLRYTLIPPGPVMCECEPL